MILKNNQIYFHPFHYSNPFPMPVEYVYEGVYNPNDRVIEIDVQVQFALDEGKWTDLIMVKALLDTGATHSHISNNILPKEVVELNEKNIHEGRAATSNLNGIWVRNVNIHLPGLSNDKSPFIIFLHAIVAYDDSETKKN